MHSILHIEDSIVNKHLLRRYFRSSDIQLIEAATGKQGIAHAENHPPDLVLLDFHLPDINGKVVAKTLRTISGLRDVPIIGLTADHSRSLHQTMLDEGFNEVLTKPINVADLLNCVSEYLGTEFKDLA